MWWVYVIQSEQPRFTKRGHEAPGFHYVGSTTNPARRLRQHQGEIKGGGRYTAKHRPWAPRALYGPYADRSEAFKAEIALKRGKRGKQRANWQPDDHPLCRGEGPDHPWVEDPTWKAD
jgi:predicted GIY-YIG superfamily endonuclease